MTMQRADVDASHWLGLMRTKELHHRGTEAQRRVGIRVTDENENSTPDEVWDHSLWRRKSAFSVSPRLRGESFSLSLGLDKVVDASLDETKELHHRGSEAQRRVGFGLRMGMKT